MNKRATTHATPTEAEAAADQAGTPAANPAAPAPAAADRAAVVSAPAPTAAQTPDTHHGQGGLYRVEKGQRLLVERSQGREDETA